MPSRPIKLHCYLDAWVHSTLYALPCLVLIVAAAYRYPQFAFPAGVATGVWLMAVHNILWAWLTERKIARQLAITQAAKAAGMLRDNAVPDKVLGQLADLSED